MEKKEQNGGITSTSGPFTEILEPERWRAREMVKVPSTIATFCFRSSFLGHYNLDLKKHVTKKLDSCCQGVEYIDRNECTTHTQNSNHSQFITPRCAGTSTAKCSFFDLVVVAKGPSRVNIQSNFLSSFIVDKIDSRDVFDVNGEEG